MAEGPCARDRRRPQANAKEGARESVVQLLDTLDFGGSDVAVRINPLNTEWVCNRAATATPPL